MFFKRTNYFHVSFISSFEIINVVIADPNVFLWIAAFFTDTAAVNHTGIKTLLANSLSTFFIKGNPVFSNGLSNNCLSNNPSDRPILCNLVFGNFILVDELFAKALWSFETLC